MNLTEVPFDQIKVGDRCVSATGVPGAILSFDPGDDGRRRGKIAIAWNSGRVSYGCIFLDEVPWLDKIEYFGPHK